MKKIIFYISLVFSLLLLISILKITFTDLDRLTNYGYGYLAGKIILFLSFLTISYFTGRKLFSR